MSNNNLLLPAAKVSGTPLSPDRGSRQSRSLTTTTAPYTGQWTRKEAVHLLKRTMFGSVKTNVDHLLTLTVSQAVDELLNNATTTPLPPINNYSTVSNTD